MTVFVEREAARNFQHAQPAPIASVWGRTLTAEAAEAGTSIGHFFPSYPQVNPPVTNVAQLPPRMNGR